MDSPALLPACLIPALPFPSVQAGYPACPPPAMRQGFLSAVRISLPAVPFLFPLLPDTDTLLQNGLPHG